ncbi:MAG: hypothetical protein HOL85_14095 [Rhodospirillaceae bacterium]|nr:hypothetical protein [Rhodospirillaceae bacterium]
MAGIIVASFAVSGILAYNHTNQALDELWKSHFHAVARAATAKAEGEIRKIHQVIDGFSSLLAIKQLALSDLHQVSDHMLVQATKLDPGMSIGYGTTDGTGSLHVRHTMDGLVRIHRSGSTTERVYSKDLEFISETPLAADLQAAFNSSDYRQQPWFRHAQETDGIAWARPYRLLTGALGISASLQARQQSGTPPSGTFHVDLPVDELAVWLSQLMTGNTGRVFILDEDGAVVIEPAGPESEIQGIRTLLKSALSTESVRDKEIKPGTTQDASVDDGGSIYRIGYSPFQVSADERWAIAVIAPKSDFLKLANSHLLIVLITATTAVLISIVIASVFARRVSRPLQELSEDLETIADLRISKRQSPDSFILEISNVGQAVDRMKAGLRSFERYVPAGVVRRLVASGKAAEFGADRRELSIFVSDIEGFTSIAETMEDDRLVDWLRVYLDHITGVVEDCSGTVDKFMGDGVLAFFNAPEAVPDHVARACRAALACQAMPRHSQPDAMPVPVTRIGLGLGHVLVGNMGSTTRFGYTVIGDMVNLTSRLEALNKVYGTRIMATAEFRDAAGPGLEWRTLDRVAVAGRKGGVTVCELLGETGGTDPDTMAARDRYETALTQYHAREFEPAAAAFSALAADRPSDIAATLMAERAGVLALDPPGEDWNRVYVFEHK